MTDAWDGAAWERLRTELDRWSPEAATVWWRDDDAGAAANTSRRSKAGAAAHAAPVSYTHLTLPTIYSV